MPPEPDRPLEPADLSDSYGEDNSMISEAATATAATLDGSWIDRSMAPSPSIRSLEKFGRPGGAGRALHLILHFV